ncbi:amidase [Candidatus Puniceispirillum sp.]|jgi:Asp-tRNA(Asn)/Glu-tRNA(Gln) amidotransferase A subunit family amidase|uniref:amidase n=1 Tax=Candidatus Puniceispirillum sp. TaxID=2026719 RepID=UPI001EBB8CAC|nr:amidase [Candidatus Puniceispirillum sp.]
MTSALEMVRMVRDGQVTSVQLVTACFDKIEEENDQLKAWAHIDRDAALARASEMDAIRLSGRPMGALHGVPVGVKDIVDTIGFPTEFGTPVMAGRQPVKDARIIAQLMDAGAIIIGKTVTTPFAFLDPSETRNPHNLDFSPGGSSSGSAVAVAAGHVPIAIGSQTNGSVIRPASFCGVYGFKPTSGILPRTGVLQTSQTLDQLGVFSLYLEDAALLADVLAIYEPADNASYPRPRPQMLSGAQADAPIEPNFVWLEMPYFGKLDDGAREGMDEVIDALGGQIERIDAAQSFKDMPEAHKIIQDYEISRNLDWALRDHEDQLFDKFADMLRRGAKISTEDYQEAIEFRMAMMGYFTSFFKDYDAILTPSSTGQATKFDAGTGDPIFCTYWTLCGLPCLTLPILGSVENMPIGVQLVGNREEDDRLMRSARWMLNKLSAPLDEDEDASEND